MRKYSQLVLILLLLLSLAACMVKPTGPIGSLKGTVTLAGETNHAGILVKVTGKNSQTTTSSSGQYSLKNLPVGTYTLNFSKTDYLSATRTVNILENSETLVEPVELKKASSTNANPVKGSITGHGTYFDFDTGTTTTDFTEGDLMLDAFTIYNNYYIMYLSETNAKKFAEPFDQNGAITFSQFAQVKTTDQPLTRENFTFTRGDVFLVKTSAGKYVKVLVYEKNDQLGTLDSPSVNFVYLYDNIIDITSPTLKEIKVRTADNQEFIQIPTGGAITFNLTSKPVSMQFVFDEFVQNAEHSNFFLNNMFPLYPASPVTYLPYYDYLILDIPQGEFGIDEPGTYTITPTASNDYFLDLSGNMLNQLPFSSIVLNYTSN